MDNIKWENKYAIYPFILPNNKRGEIVVHDHGKTFIKIYNLTEQLIFSESFKNFEKAMIYIKNMDEI